MRSSIRGKRSSLLSRCICICENNGICEKYHKNAVDKEIKIRQQQAFQNITYTPQELAKFERERKLAEMNKYKEDLDTSSPQTNSRIKVKERSMTGVVEGRNDFNLINASTSHNPILNPLPYNIQNPSILRDMQRKRQISEQHNSYAHPYWYFMAFSMIQSFLSEQ